MKTLAGYNIEQLPFEISKVQDILYADGPILTHYTDIKGKDLLFYWTDFNENYNRWLIWETNKKSLFNYLSGGISLYQHISERSEDFVFSVDIDGSGKHYNTMLLNSYAIPEDYYPDQDSFYTLGLPKFYEDYLTEWNYLSRLRERSYVFKLTPTNRIHESTVPAKEAGQFLLGITKSIESYIDATATECLKHTIGDRTKLNRTINQIKEKVSPRIADTSFSSFEVSIAIDNMVLPAGNQEIDRWGKEVISGYRNDVLDVDYSKEEETVSIIERFPDPETRKKIFDPIFRILDNPTFSLSVSSYNKDFLRDFKRIKLLDSFKTRILPTQSVEDIIKLHEQKAKIVTAIFKVPEGGSISDLRKKELFENLLFTEEGSQQTIPINSPIVKGDDSIFISRPLECKVTVDGDNIILSNEVFELYAVGSDIKTVTDSIRGQFINLVSWRQTHPEYTDEKTQALDDLIVYQKK